MRPRILHLHLHTADPSSTAFYHVMPTFPSTQSQSDALISPLCGPERRLGGSPLKETGNEEFQFNDPKAEWAGLLEKKGTSVVRVQKKVGRVDYVMLPPFYIRISFE